MNFRDLFERQNVYFRDTVRHTDAKSRVRKLSQMREWIMGNREQIGQAVYADLKKSVPETDLTEIKASLLEIDHARKNLRRWMKPKRAGRSLLFLSASGKTVAQPKGVCLIISPWNFPFLLSIGPLTAAIAAGNCVILKPSEMAPQTSRLLCRMAEELFPAQEISVVEGGVETAQALLKLPFDHIFFTGSTRVGKIVMEAAAQNLSSLTLELGGENPAIVDDTARIELTARRLVWGRFINCGQACVAPNTVYVHESIREPLTVAVKRQIGMLFPGAKKNNPDYGRIIDEKNFRRIAELLDDAGEKQARVIYGGNTDEKELFIEPTVLECNNREARVFREEIFGPLLVLHGYKELDDVLAFINEGHKPLALYVFSQNRKAIDYIISNSASGGVGINDTTLQFAHPHLPFGGENHSGLGRGHGYHGFLAFSNERAVFRQSRWNTSALIYPPYTAGVKKIINIILRYF